MTEDRLAVWMDGMATPAGHLERSDEGDTSFAYARNYLDAGGPPLSLSLPLADAAYDDRGMRAFFANLLPENAQLQRILDREGLERGNVVGQLRHLGADCAGAVSCLPMGDPPVKTPGRLDADYEPLDDAAAIRIVRSLAELRRLPAEVDDPSPVAGVQSKIALTVLPDGRFALPRAGLRVPTTHILKVPERRHGRDARLEEAAALLAAACGLEVSVPQAIKVGDYEALLIERFDRRVAQDTVTRIHQEDFAQALGFSSELKYERRGREGRKFDVSAALSVLDRTADPEAARLGFVLATLFNLRIGNTDNHAKNHALLYDTGGPPRLAPLYDMLPIRLHDRYNHQLAFKIGQATLFDEMTSDDVATFLIECGVEDVPGFVGEAVVPLVRSLEKATPTLRSQGMRTFDDLIGRETERLVDLLSAAVELRARCVRRARRRLLMSN
ncbi:HipA domain-containing protein [Novosphingobium sp. Gsoil 351]|uniref:HipA domain-containing protein n=1 Tax=Novosphingobium sp. Gsoil 351 TaxID=2675225 RepID=UPI0012B4A6C9|nr:HipA domain-containing protein [Novosphingobium sp. Gsoil 351]QGN55744.1 type II toxin-antitoxin system HipA family toxin [Novosphingobium sp. Gsoil 351]